MNSFHSKSFVEKFPNYFSALEQDARAAKEEAERARSAISEREEAEDDR